MRFQTYRADFQEKFMTLVPGTSLHFVYDMLHLSQFTGR